MTATLLHPDTDLDVVDPELAARFAEIVDGLTRRGLLGVGVGTAALAGLAACGSGTGPAPDSSASAASRLVNSVNGRIAVPGRPTRVVTLDDFSMAAMFDLGVLPVGVYSAGAEYVEPQFLAKWRKIPKISNGTVGGAIDIEKVAALRPDLIIGIDAQKPPYDQLEEIAPTVILPFSTSKAPWRDMARDTAVALGQGDAFRQLQQQYAKRAASIATTYADLLGRLRWDVLQGGFDSGVFWLYGAASPVGGILGDAGVRLATASASVGATGQANVSYEEIGRLSDADAIFYYTTNDGQPANLGPKLFAQPLWRRLPAVEDGHLFGTIYFLPSGYSDALGVLDALEAALKKLGGDR